MEADWNVGTAKICLPRVNTVCIWIWYSVYSCYHAHQYYPFFVLLFILCVTHNYFLFLLTAQEVTRAHKGWALDSVVLHNDITKMMKEDITAPPQEGVYVHGLYLEGAGWDKRNCKLIEPTNKVLFTPLPVAHVYAINSVFQAGTRYYACPVYKKPRRTDLTFITALLLQTSQHPDHWVLRGAALLCDTK